MGSVSLMPWLSYTSGCDIDSNCGELSELVVWDMETLDPCNDEISKPNIGNSMTDVSTSAKSSNFLMINGNNNSSHALALGKGRSSRFKVGFSPTQGQSGRVINLVYSVKSIIDQEEYLCDTNPKIEGDTEVDYSIAILSRGKQMYMGLKSVSTEWSQEIIDLDYISDYENMFSEKEPLELEVIITNFTTSSNAMLGLDDLVIEGRECLFDDSLAYEWSTGETTERIYSIKKGNYCVTVTDCNGCQAVDCISVN